MKTYKIRRSTVHDLMKAKDKKREAVKGLRVVRMTRMFFVRGGSSSKILMR